MRHPVHAGRTQWRTRGATDEQPGGQHHRIARTEHQGRPSTGTTQRDVGELRGHPVQISEVLDGPRGGILRLQAGGSICVGRIRQAVTDLA